MAKLITRLLLLLLVAGSIGAVYYASTKQSAQKQAGPGGQGKRGGVGADLPVPVIGGTARLADIPLYLDGVGTAKPLSTVTVRPQVDGRLLKLHFREGQTVQKGDLLAEIDATTYKAQLDQAVARRALTETQLANARRDAERYARIPGVVAQKTVDTQIALVAQLEAQIKADAAAVANAQAILDYTRILAPTTGRTGLRLVDEGNLIRASDQGLVTITQVQPIAVQFTLPQQQLSAVNRALAAGVVKAQAIDADGKTEVDAGTLEVVDNQVDQTTGTVRMKAEFANARLQLWPGQFVNVRVLVDTLKQVVVVPTQAVQRGPNGTFVYLVGAEDRVAMRPVVLSQQGETDSVVRTGLQAGDRIVIAGFSRLQEGARVVFGQQGGEPPPPRPAGASAPVGGAGAVDRTARASAGGGLERLRLACGSDIAEYCAGIAREDLRACLATNRTKFSAGCQTALAERDAQGGTLPGSGEARGRRSGAAAAPGDAADGPAARSTRP